MQELLLDTSVLDTALHEYLQGEVQCLVEGDRPHIPGCRNTKDTSAPRRYRRLEVLLDPPLCCLPAWLKEGPAGLLEVVNVLAHLPDGPYADPGSAERMAAWVCELAGHPAASALLPQAQTFVEEASRDLERWKASDEAEELLDEWGSLMSFPALTFDELGSLLFFEDPLPGGSILSEEGLGEIDGLLEHHENRTRKAGELLVQTKGQARCLFDNAWLDGAAEKHLLGERVLRLPRGLEAALRRSSQVHSTAVLRTGDAVAVLETAVVLLEENDVSAAQALKVARELA